MKKKYEWIDERVEEAISILDTYEINDKMQEFDILHMYPKENACPDGYYDSKFFDLHLFNSMTKEKRIIERRDGLGFVGNIDLMAMRIYVDGSTFVRFGSMHKANIFQCVDIV